MQHLDAERVHKLTDYPGLVAALKQMNREGVDALDRMLLSEAKANGVQNDWLMLPAWRYGRSFGIKLVSVFPENPEADRPAVQGLYALFDGKTGAAIATLDGAALTLVKTAANSAMAADLLARRDRWRDLDDAGGCYRQSFIPLVERKLRCQVLEVVLPGDDDRRGGQDLQRVIKTGLRPR